MPPARHVMRPRPGDRPRFTPRLAIGICLVISLSVAAWSIDAAGGARNARAKEIAAPAKAPAPAPAPAPATDPRLAWTLVGLGDSVPAGTACNCPNYVTLYGEDLAAALPMNVTTINLSVPGQTSGQLLAMLQDDPAVDATLARANLVTITIGANDFSYQTYLGGDCAQLSCYQSAVAAMGQNLAGIISRIQTLRAGQPTVIKCTGYWEIWRDGAVGRSRGATYMIVGETLTREVNAVISQVAASHGVGYVGLSRAFRGPTGQTDDTDLLAADGNHPNAAGHRLIAQQLFLSGLGRPGPPSPAPARGVPGATA